MAEAIQLETCKAIENKGLFTPYLPKSPIDIIGEPETRPAPMEKKMSEWNPIETAPLNVPILVTGGLMEDELTDEPFQYGAAVVETSSGKHFSAIHSCYYSVWVNNPTHWMPLPPPPK